MAWTRMAKTYGIPVQILQHFTTTTEFYNWLELEKLELNEVDKLSSYLRLLCAEVRRSYVKHPERVKVSDFILTFGADEGPRDDSYTDENRQLKNAMSRAFWSATLNSTRKPKTDKEKSKNGNRRPSSRHNHPKAPRRRK